MSNREINAEFEIHTALHDEASEGWIWGILPGVQARSLVVVKNPSTGKRVLCEYREIDDFFVDKYCEARPRKAPSLSAENYPLVVNLWYRRDLGIETFGKRVRLTIAPARTRYLSAIRAGIVHPNYVVRLATRLGVLSLWLGLQSIFMSALSFISSPFWTAAILIASAGTGLSCLFVLHAPRT